jgi:dTDP-3,4-didehydro-2,6-dideoxy-alpha-D-glucose 3-reductase
MTDPVRPVRFGVVGCADIARRRVLPALRADSGVDLVAIASRDAAKAGRFAAEFGAAAIHGYERLLERPDIDAVYLPLPPGLHAEWIERALLAGKHVLAEKPLTTDAASSKRLIELAASLGLVLFENVMFPHHSQHATVRKLVADGTIGEIRGFASAFTMPARPHSDIRYRADIGGGALLDLGLYPLRAALHFLGEDLAVAGAVLRYDLRCDVDTSGKMLLYTSDGVQADLTFGMEHSYLTGYELAGSEGRLLVDRVFTPPHNHQPVVVIERQDHREQIVLPADDQVANVVRLVTRAIAGGGDLGEWAGGTLRQAQLADEVRAQAHRSTF